MTTFEASIDRLESAVSSRLDLLDQMREENAMLKARIKFLTDTINHDISTHCGFFCALPECPKSMTRFSDEQQKPVGP